jgi:hypothetical protein
MFTDAAKTIEIKAANPVVAKLETADQESAATRTQNPALAVPHTTKSTDQSSGMLLVIGILALVAFLGALLIWQLQHAPFALFGLLIRSSQ